ncbi:hypothetical protein, partial [Limnobacter sp.]|uniref:hypothetical protein n=1 Tax=Limnobacter sp. TaxID=2003368 RepID=UPI00311E4AAC
MTRIMMIKIGAPRVFTLSPARPDLMKSKENAVEATIPPIKLLTVQLWKTLGFLNGGIEGELPSYCGLGSDLSRCVNCPIDLGSDLSQLSCWLNRLGFRSLARKPVDPLLSFAMPENDPPKLRVGSVLCR